MSTAILYDGTLIKMMNNHLLKDLRSPVHHREYVVSVAPTFVTYLSGLIVIPTRLSTPGKGYRSSNDTGFFSPSSYRLISTMN